MTVPQLYGPGEPAAFLSEPLSLSANAHRVWTEALDLTLSKHEDYGPYNIALSPGGPLNGLRVRMHDKLARLNHLVDNAQDPQHESLRDTLIDLANYALIGVLVIDGCWPGMPS